MDTKFNESKRKELTAQDVRFTRKGHYLYAFFMGWPEKPEVIITPLATGGGLVAGKVGSVELLGFRGQLRWTQDEAGLKVQLPVEKPGRFAFALKLNGLKLDQV
jgi:alpha-L-fucosidase